jgi:hypothetical protein
MHKNPGCTAEKHLHIGVGDTIQVQKAAGVDGHIGAGMTCTSPKRSRKPPENGTRCPWNACRNENSPEDSRSRAKHPDTYRHTRRRRQTSRRRRRAEHSARPPWTCASPATAAPSTSQAPWALSVPPKQPCKHAGTRCALRSHKPRGSCVWGETTKHGHRITCMEHAAKASFSFDPSSYSLAVLGFESRTPILTRQETAFLLGCGLLEAALSLPTHLTWASNAPTDEPGGETPHDHAFR